MNAYRVCLILCRAVAVALWWNVGLRLLSATITLIVAQLSFQMNIGHATMGASFYLELLTLAVPQIIAAVFLQVFAVSLASSVAGISAFGGETMASPRKLDALELNLARAGAGLYLLFFGVASAIPSILGLGYRIFTGGIGSGTGNSTTVIYSLLASLIPLIIQCFVGFVLAFKLGLRRLIHSDANM